MPDGDEATHERRRLDVLHRLRTGTADLHREAEDALDLLHPALGRDRLAEVLTRLHGFWVAAEAGLDDWAARTPADADVVGWAQRRRSALFAADLRALGHRAPAAAPRLAAVADTDEALGRLYVLEGSTLGGAFIDRHLASLPALSDVRIRAFTPYGSRTGAMWAAFRQVTRDRVAAGGDVDRIVGSARATFGALAGWCGSAPPAPASA